jgi:hypothetical protein
MRNLTIGILSRCDLANPVLAREVLSTLETHHPDLRPLRFGGFEPLPFKLEPSDSSLRLLEHWKSPVFWSHRRRSEGSFFFGRSNRHSTLYLSCTPTRIPPTAAAALLTDLSTILTPDLAYVYYVNPSRDDYMQRYAAVYPFAIGITTHDLIRSLPDLPWLAILGSPYVHLFGVDTLASCPSSLTRRLSSGLWHLQLGGGSSWSEVDTHYRDTLEAAKEHLGLSHFLNLASPEAMRAAPVFPGINDSVSEDSPIN